MKKINMDKLVDQSITASNACFSIAFLVSTKNAIEERDIIRAAVNLAGAIGCTVATIGNVITMKKKKEAGNYESR